MEFLILSGISTVMLVVLLVIGTYQLQAAQEQRAMIAVQDIVSSVQQELITANAVQDGYRRTFTLPPTILNKPYTLKVEDQGAVGFVTLNWSNRLQSIRTPVCAGTLQPGDNIVRKENGQILCNS
jgi:hypothetical protein